MAQNFGIRANVGPRAGEHRSGREDANANGSVNASAGDGAELTIEQILGWADAYRAEHGTWPAVGPLTVTEAVSGAPGVSWKTINHALAFGLRGLPGDSSLAELLAEHRGAPLPDMGPETLARKIWAWEQEQFPVRGPRRHGPRGPADAPPRYPALTIDQILAWADAHRAATGKWPTADSGPVRDAAHGETWRAIEMALRKGGRGLPSGLTLARLRPGYVAVRPPLTHALILAWADAHHAALGEWPTRRSGPVKGVPRECWSTIDTHLSTGGRGLPGGECLGSLLATHRGVPNQRFRRRLSVEQILAWADAYFTAHGIWPGHASGPVDGAPGETWAGIDRALRNGRRGLPGGTTLVRLLVEHRRRRASGRTPGLTEEQILAWADAHHAATGRWPNIRAGAIGGTRRETWASVDDALREGDRGLPGGTSLARLLSAHRGVRNRMALPGLTVEQVLAWADAYHVAHGRWPTPTSGPVAGAPGEKWRSLEDALRHGSRGLPGGLNLKRLLFLHRNVAPPAVPRAVDRSNPACPETGAVKPLCGGTHDPDASQEVAGVILSPV